MCGEVRRQREGVWRLVMVRANTKGELLLMARRPVAGSPATRPHDL